MKTIDEIEENSEIIEKTCCKRVMEEVEQRLNKMAELYDFLKTWEEAIGEKNLRIYLREKSNGTGKYWKSN